MDDILRPINCDQPFMLDLSRQLPRIADRLGANHKDLAVYEYGTLLINDYMSTEYRDPVIDIMGSIPNIPYVQRGGRNSKGKRGYGFIIYQSRLSPDIKYAIFSYRGPDWEEQYLIIERSKVFRYYRNATRLNEKSDDDHLAPILPDGILEDMIQNTVGFLLQADEIGKLGVRIKRGVILDGDPGNGKTMLCRYIQKLCVRHGIKWGTVTSSDIDCAYNNQSLEDLFTEFTVTFFDDIDIACMDRSRGDGKLACSLLSAMDGMNSKGHLVRVFTTNETVSKLDPAFIRPGRIDKCITLVKPNADLRRKLVETVWPKVITSNIDVDYLIQETEGYSFADLESIRTNLVTHSVLGKGKKWDLEEAFDQREDRNTERRAAKVGFGG